jgi:hypothetical protein
VHDLAATGGVPDVDGVLEIEMGSQRSQVIGVVVGPCRDVAGLRGASLPALVLDHALSPAFDVAKASHLARSELPAQR